MEGQGDEDRQRKGDRGGVRFPRHMGGLRSSPRAPPNEAWQPVSSVGAASLAPASSERGERREGENHKRETRERILFVTLLHSVSQVVH